MRTILLLAISLSIAIPLSAQNYGEITGVVTDPSRGAISAAEITITNLATNQVRQVPTSSSGAYSVPFLVPGQ